MSLFSVPTFLRMPAVGLDISDDAIRFIEFRQTSRGMEVARFATRPLAEGIVVSGRVVDPVRLKESIAVLAKEFHISFANISLPEEQAYLANIRIPHVAEHEIRGVLELKLEEHVPIPGAQAVFDYVLAHGSEGSREYLDTVVSVLPSDVIHQYSEIFEGSGVTPLGFELESQAIARSVVKWSDLGSFMVVDIGKTITSIFVIARGVVQFAASVDMGGQYLTEAIKKKFSVEDKVAEEMKVKHGIVASKQKPEIWDAVSRVVGDFRDKIAQHYSYWQTHHGEKFGGAIERIYLSGGGANLKGLSEYLALGLSTPVHVANPWVNVNTFEHYIPPIHQQGSLSFSVAIGLALREYAPPHL
jgi:type IV pilus assembly protein PilM